MENHKANNTFDKTYSPAYSEPTEVTVLLTYAVNAQSAERTSEDSYIVGVPYKKLVFLAPSTHMWSFLDSVKSLVKLRALWNRFASASIQYV